jgi:cAMP phosphodiesterase
MNIRIPASLLIFLCHFLYASGQRRALPAFDIIPLGVKGGIDESNLSAYMLAAEGSSNYVCLDAGTLNYGLQKAVAAGIFRDSASMVLKHNVRGYLISHPHLDHVAGLVINSPDDTRKTIYGLSSCINVLRDKYFTWENWANFGDDGEKPVLKKYHYKVLVPGIETPLDSTTLTVVAFPLSHGNPFQSTAFLISNRQDQLLYLGDTGADTIERAGNLRMLWQQIAPIITGRHLRAIFIEVSYPDEQPLSQLFGHLTPGLLMHEMKVLEGITGINTLRGLNVVITHMKPSGLHEAMIRKQLIASNKLGLNLIFPQQAKRMRL